jgi:hypothetical protein
MYRSTPFSIAKAVYRIAGKFGGELNLAVWRIDQPTAKLKSANIKSFPYFARAKAIEVTWWVWSLGSKLVDKSLA